MQIAKKISTAGINNVRKGFPKPEKKTFVARILGEAQKCEVIDGVLGQSIKFVGQFKGINQDGEETIAPVCYLPAPADAVLKTAIDNADGSPVNFGFDFTIVPDGCAMGYKYDVTPLLKFEPSDVMKAIEAGIQPLKIEASNQPQLPHVNDVGAKVEPPHTAKKSK